jgi:hypothetical protein
MKTSNPALSDKTFQGLSSAQYGGANPGKFIEQNGLSS